MTGTCDARAVVLSTTRHRKLRLRGAPFRWAFIVASFFPWVSFNTNSLDMQPWPLIFAIILISTDKKLNLSSAFIYSIVVVAIGFFWALIVSNSANFLAVRAFYGFSSFYIFYAAASSTIKRRYNILPLAKVLNIIWLIGALIEVKFPVVLAVFGKVRTTSGRGVTSFAPEPSFFVAFLIFSSALILVLDGYNFRRSKKVHLANILAVLLLAKSAIGIAYLAVLGLCYLGYLILRMRPKKRGVYFLAGIAAVIVAVPILLNSLTTDTRVLSLLMKLAAKGPLLLIKLDASINERVAHVVLPIHGAIRNFFLPLGFDTFSESREFLQRFYNGFFWQSTGTDKIMSWFGEWIYTLGIFGVTGLVLIYFEFLKLSREARWTLTSISIILFSAIPVSFPLVGILFAYVFGGGNYGQYHYRDFDPVSPK